MKSRDLKDLRHRIIDEMNYISRETYRNAITNVYFRLTHCQDINKVTI